MSSYEEIWRRKSDEELLQVMTRLSDFTDEGRQAVISELKRRGIELPSQEEQSNQRVAQTVQKMTRRYSDAYRVAGAVTGLGSVIKVVGGILGLGIIALGLSGNSNLGFLNLILGLSVGFLFWIVGVIVSAQGQILLASLDTALNTSTLVSNADKISIMGLD